MGQRKSKAGMANIQGETNASQYLSIPYTGDSGPETLQTLDLYLPPLPTGGSFDSSYPKDQMRPPPLIVFVHGGAWRSGTSLETQTVLAPKLVENYGYAVACPNYRLSPVVKHPTHIEDVLKALEWLTREDLAEGVEKTVDGNGGMKRWDRDRLVLVGHSCGAFIIGSIALSSSPPAVSPLNDHHPEETNWGPNSPNVPVPDKVRRSIIGCIFVDGIYSLEALVDEYPSYSDFVEQAFGDERSLYEGISITSLGNPDSKADIERKRRPRYLVLHSRKDELLTLRQPDLWVGHLRKIGLGDETEADYDSITSGHYDLVDSEDTVNAIAKFTSSL